MSRKPAHIELAGGKGARQRTWDLIRGFGKKPWAWLDVTPKGVADTTVRSYLTGLQLAGYIGEAGTKASTSGAPIKLYKLLRDNGIEAPRVDRKGKPVKHGDVTEQMWKCLRMYICFVSPRELAFFSSTADVRVPEQSARNYLRLLDLAGYVDVDRDARPALYCLKAEKNTGPRAPMQSIIKGIYDPNLDKVVWMAPVDPEAAIYGR